MTASTSDPSKVSVIDRPAETGTSGRPAKPSIGDVVPCPVCEARRRISLHLAELCPRCQEAIYNEQRRSGEYRPEKDPRNARPAAKQLEDFHG